MLSQYEPLSRNYVPLHQECERVYGATTSGLLRAAVVPSKVLTIPDTVPIRKVLTVPVSTDIQNSLYMVYVGGSKGCRKLYGPLYSVFPTSNELDRPAVSAAAK